MNNKENRCASCGKLIVDPSKGASEGDNVFCDKICRAKYHKGDRYVWDEKEKPIRKNHPEKQKKYVGRLIEGVVSIILGLILTAWSKNHDYLKGYYIIFYGPVLWGIVAIGWGALGLWKVRK
jgi:hypothetical protein